MLLILCFAVVLGIPATQAYGKTHDVSIEWYYSLSDSTEDIKLDSTQLTTENGLFDYSSYVKNPNKASFYRMYGVVPIIRINGKYFWLSMVYVESNSPQDQVAYTIDVGDEDTDIVIRLYYAQLEVTPVNKKDKIRVSVDSSANENLTEPWTYSAYQIFHVSKAPTVQEDVTTDETIGHSIGAEDTGFAYYIKTTDPWYSVIAGMTDYFTLVPAGNDDTFFVLLNEGIDQNEATAIAIANILEQHTDGKDAITLTSGEANNNVDPGYYLIVSPITSNLILATTNIDITEKAFYPTITKAVADADKNSALNSKIHFSSTISIPKGSKAEMVITDTATEGLNIDVNSLKLNPDILCQTDVTSTGFKLTISADTIKNLCKDNTVNLNLSYTGVLNDKAAVLPRDDNTIEGNINEIKLEYVNYVQTSEVDVNTTKFSFIKYDTKDLTKTPIAGATFRLLDENNNPVELYEIKPSEEYRVKVASDTDSMTDITTAKNKAITIWGLDADTTYKLKEIKAPDGYIADTTEIEVKPADNLGTRIEIGNSSGSLLPSTGGIGTSCLYFLGVGLVAIAIALFLKNKKDLTN